MTLPLLDGENGKGMGPMGYPYENAFVLVSKRLRRGVAQLWRSPRLNANIYGDLNPKGASESSNI